MLLFAVVGFTAGECSCYRSVCVCMGSFLFRGCVSAVLCECTREGEKREGRHTH